MKVLITQQSQRDADRPNGVGRMGFSQIREQLSGSRDITDHCRQRLLELEQRLVRVQALGNEYPRIEFSDQVKQKLRGKSLFSATSQKVI